MVGYSHQIPSQSPRQFPIASPKFLVSPGNHTSSASSYQKSARPPKQGVKDCGSDCPPASKRHRLLSPTSLPTYDRLADVPRQGSDPSNKLLTNPTFVVRLRTTATSYSRQLPCQLFRELTSGSPRSHKQAVPQAIARGVLQRSFLAVKRLRSLKSLHTSPYRSQPST